MSKELMTKDPTESPVIRNEADFGMSDTQAMLQLVQKLATSTDIEIDRVNQAFSLYEKMKSMDAEQKFNEAMAKAQADIEPVAANCKNGHTNSTFADLSAIHKLCKPIWTSHGFSVSSNYYDAEKPDWIGVDCEVMHASGFKKKYSNAFPLDIAGSGGKVNKTRIQAIGSTVSYARRYTEIMIFDISVDRDDDGNGAANKKLPAQVETLNQSQLKKLKEEIISAGITETGFCQRVGIAKVDDLQQGRLKGAIAWLKTQKPKAATAKPPQDQTDDEWIAEIEGQSA